MKRMSLQQQHDQYIAKCYYENGGTGLLWKGPTTVSFWLRLRLRLGYIWSQL